jgi:hypothetical protein
MVLVAVLLVYQGAVMLLPGAMMSTQLPQFEKLDRASELVVDPTVMADEDRAGDTLQAFWFSLPAATTTVTPAFRIRVTALSVVVLAPPPRLIFATAGLM